MISVRGSNGHHGGLRQRLLMDIIGWYVRDFERVDCRLITQEQATAVNAMMILRLTRRYFRIEATIFP